MRYLKIRFANALFPAELPWFRAAVIEKTQRQSTLFHNHQPPDGFLYRYPLIQYKIDHRKAAIICLNEGTDDIHYLLQERQLNLRIGHREEVFSIEDVELRYHNVQAWQARFTYALKDWQALNQENFQAYRALETEVERLQFLEKILRSNLLAFASGIGWQAEQQLDARITHFKGERRLPYKGQKVLAFTLNFSTNVSLPDFIGLGKGVSVGFGSVLGIGKGEVGNRKGEVGRSKGGSGKPVEQPNPEGLLLPEPEQPGAGKASAEQDNAINHHNP